MADKAARPAGERRDYIDALKGLAIILVVWGHFSEYYRTDWAAFNGLFECIYLFHMPMFCLCSGMVAKWRPGKLVFQQVWLYLLSQGVILWMRLYVWVEELEPDASLLWEWLLPWRHMWYLYALIFWELTVPLLRLARDKGRLPGSLLVMAAALALGLWGGTRTWEYGLVRVVGFYPLFAAGYLFAPLFDAADRAARRRWWLRPAALAVFAAVYLRWLLQVLNAPEPVYESPRIFHDVAYTDTYTMRTRFAFYLIGILTTLVLVPVVGKSRFLARMGRRTLPIYLVHMPLYAYFYYLKIFETVRGYAIEDRAAIVALVVGGCLAGLGSAPMCALFNGIANIWYRGVPALVHRLQGRGVQKE